MSADEAGAQRRPGPSAFSAYASRFLAGRPAEDSQIFRPASPTSSSHDPFQSSPTASTPYPHLRGSSRSPSPTRTPPFPGPGIAGIPDMDDSIGVGLLFADGHSDDEERHNRATSSNRVNRTRIQADLPNPYAASSSSDDDMEADLDQVETVRRSLLANKRTKKGWLAHQSVFPPSSSSSASESDKDTEPESDEGDMEPPSNLQEPLLGPDEMRGGPSTQIPVRLQVYHGRFAHWEREGLRKYKDSGVLALWLTSCLGVLIGLIFVWGPTESPPDAPNRSRPSVIPLLPLLIALLIPPLILPPAFLFFLRHTVRPVLMATSVAIPFSLFLCGWWAFGASFETVSPNAQDPWWGTTGLRLCAGFLWLLSIGFGRLVWTRRKRMERTVAVVELSTDLLLTHRPLLLLTPLLLAVFALASIPFLTLLIRLGTIGYWRHPKQNTWIFHIRPYAGWLIFLVTLLWLWTWGILRGIGRVAVAGVIGEWYFHRNDDSHPAPLDVTTAAVHRATGTSLGSICTGAGIIAIVRVIGRSASELKRITSSRNKFLPSPLAFLSALTPMLTVVTGILDQLNGYALVYVGVTGDAFWPSARRAVRLAGRRNGGHLLDYTLIKLLLTLSSIAMGMFTATAGYLYMTHSLNNPGYAPVAALLCGGVPFLVIRAGAAVLTDACDALFICYQIDREMGGKHSEAANAAFSDEKRGSSGTV